MESPVREVELVLQVSPEGAAALARHSRMRVQGTGRSTNRPLRCLYFDTPTLDLARAGLHLRIERVGRDYVQTVQSRASHGWNHPDDTRPRARDREPERE